MIRFQLYDSSICIVNAHLAAHKNNVQGRNSDFHAICNRIKFTDKNKITAKGGGQSTIFEHESVPFPPILCLMCPRSADRFLACLCDVV